VKNKTGKRTEHVAGKGRNISEEKTTKRVVEIKIGEERSNRVKKIRWCQEAEGVISGEHGAWKRIRAFNDRCTHVRTMRVLLRSL